MTKIIWICILMAVSIFVACGNPNSARFDLEARQRKERASFLEWEARQLEEERRWNDKYNPSFSRAVEQLRELADNGCLAPFDDCRAPFMAKWYVLKAMERENIAFGANTITEAELNELEARAEARIATQKFAYLKAKGGAKLPADLRLLDEVCEQVYAAKRPLIGGNPTDAELKRLLPPGVTKPDRCFWQ